MNSANPEYPRVVALVPAFNSSAFIEKTLDSIAEQTYSNLRVLISNDASTDDTGPICETYAAKDPRFSVIHQSQNLGWIGNVNALFDTAKGEYLFFAFHDDILMPDFVASLVCELEADPAAILAFPDIEVLGIDGEISKPILKEFDGVIDRFERVRLMARKPPWNAIPNRGIFRASAPGLVGGLKRNFAGEFVADWPWLLSLLIHGTFVRVPTILCRKVLRQAGVAASWSYNPLNRLAVVISCGSVIRKGPFSHSEEWSLYLTIVRSYPLLPWQTVRRWLKQKPLLRRLYLTAVHIFLRDKTSH